MPWISRKLSHLKADDEVALFYADGQVHVARIEQVNRGRIVVNGVSYHANGKCHYRESDSRLAPITDELRRQANARE